MPYVRKTFECYSCNKRTTRRSVHVMGGVEYCYDCMADASAMFPCDCCGKMIHGDHIHLENGAQHCHTCVGGRQVRCTSCPSMLVTRRGRVENMVDDKPYCSDCFETHFDSCHECSEIVDRCDALQDPDNRTLCEDCYDERCVVCYDCDAVVWRLDSNECYNGWRCDGCYDADHDEDYYGSGWSARPFAPDSNSYRRIGSRRCYGVELEFTNAPGARRSAEPLYHFGQIGEHCGVEYRSSILQGDGGLRAIEGMTNFAQEHDWQLSNNCGLHLHVDLRNEPTDALRVLAYAYCKTYYVWRRFVKPWRRNSCSFCRRPDYTLEDIRAIDNFARWARRTERYTFVNWTAYSEHTTIEIRMHDATDNGTEVTNWVKAHTRFVDWALQQSFDSVDEAFPEVENHPLTHGFNAMAEIWDSPSLKAYYRSRAVECGTRFATARTLQTA